MSSNRGRLGRKSFASNASERRGRFLLRRPMAGSRIISGVLGMMIVAFGLGSPMPARAGVADELRTCRAIQEQDRRLACYDAIGAAASTPARVEPPSPAAAAPQALPSSAAAAPPSAAPASSFGASALPPPPSLVDEQKNLRAKLTGSLRAVRRGMRIDLDNGQQWLSTGDQEYDCEVRQAEVVIDRNIIGSYWMAVPECGARFRVRRVR